MPGLLQFQRPGSVAKQRALNDMPLNFRRPFDDAPAARMTKDPRQLMALTQSPPARRLPKQSPSPDGASSVPNNLTLAASARTSIF